MGNTQSAEQQKAVIKGSVRRGSSVVAQARPKTPAEIVNGLMGAKNYSGAILEINKNIPLDASRAGYWHYKRAECHLVLSHYEDAARDYVKAIQAAYEEAKVRRKLEELVEASAAASARLFAFYITDKEKNTLLHFASAQGYERLVGLLVETALTAHRVDYVLQGNSAKKTALMLAVEKNHAAVIPRLIKPLVSLIWQISSHPISNKSVYEITEAVDSAEASSLSLRRMGDEKTFIQAMDNYKIKIREASCKNEKKQLIEASQKLALDRFKYENAIQASEPAQSPLKSSFGIIDVLQNFLTTHVLRRLGTENTQVQNFISILSILKTIGGEEKEITHTFIQGVFHGQAGGIYFPLLSVGLQLYVAIKNQKYEHMFAAVFTLLRYWADNYAGMQERMIAQRLCDMAQDFFMEEGSEAAIFQKISCFYGALESSPESSYVVKLAGCYPTIQKTMEDVKALIHNGRTEEARKKYQNLIFYWLILSEIYPESSYPVLKQQISSIVLDLNISSLLEYEGINVLIPLSHVFTKVADSKIESTIDARKTAALLSKFLDDFKKEEETKSRNRIFILFKLFSSLLLDYGAKNNHSICTYLGMLGLGISHAYFVGVAIMQETSHFEAMKKISKEIPKFLETIQATQERNGRDTTSLGRIWASSMLINLIMNVISEVRTGNNAFDACLQSLDNNLDSYVRALKAKIEGKTSADPMLLMIHNLLKMTQSALLVGGAVRIAYQLMTGKPFERLQANLNKYLPQEVASLAMNGLRCALQGVPIIGGMVASMNVAREIQNSTNTLKSHINATEQKILSSVKELSNQMMKGFEKVEQSTLMIRSQLKGVEAQLAEIQKMLSHLQGLTLDFALAGKMGAFTKQLKMNLKAAQKHYKMLEEKATTEACVQFLLYLRPGDHEGEMIFTVYNKKIADWLGFFYEYSAEKETDVLMPNLSLWLDLMTTFLKFLSVANQAAIRESECFTQDHFEEVFKRAQDVERFLQYLHSKKALQDFLQKAQVQDVAPENLRALACYTELLGIPLLGYGEDADYWSDDKTVVWRKNISSAISDALAEMPPSIISDALSATQEIVKEFRRYLDAFYLPESNDCKREASEESVESTKRIRSLSPAP